MRPQRRVRSGLPPPPPSLWVQRLPARIRGWIQKSPRIRGVLAVEFFRFRTRDGLVQRRSEPGGSSVSVGPFSGSVSGWAYNQMRSAPPKPYAELCCDQRLTDSRIREGGVDSESGCVIRLLLANSIASSRGRVCFARPRTRPFKLRFESGQSLCERIDLHSVGFAD
jgi:hypothetical protein